MAKKIVHGPYGDYVVNVPDPPAQKIVHGPYGDYQAPSKPPAAAPTVPNWAPGPLGGMAPSGVQTTPANPTGLTPAQLGAPNGASEPGGAPAAPESAAPAAPAAPVAPPPATPPAFDPLNDAWYVGLHNALLTDKGTQENAALEAKRTLLQNLGSSDLYNKTLGANDPFASLVSADPNTSNSTFANLARGYGRNQETTNKNLNRQNLFYSGARGKQLRQLAQDYVSDQSGAVKAATDQLVKIGQAITDYMTNTFNPNETRNLGDARTRYIQQYGVNP